MPAFNVGRVLGPALASVLAQTYAPFEIILLDDGSSDETGDVARGFGGPRIRYVRNETNLGGYQTMNKAIGLARGDLIAVYHSDDIYDPTIIEREVAFLEAHPEAGAVFCLDRFMDDAGKIFGEARLPPELACRALLRYEEVFRALLRHKNIFLRCPTFMARRGVFDEVGLFDAETYDIAADVDMWIRIVRRFPIGVLDEHLMTYRVGGGQWSSRHNYLRTDQELFFSIMDRYLEVDGWRDRLKGDDLLEYRHHRCADETFRALNWLIRGDRARALALLPAGYPWAALAAKPSVRKLRLLALRIAAYALARAHPRRDVRSLAHRLAYRRRFLPQGVEPKAARHVA
jgi:glycosyltransferase involved in cell wall biosynthesis